MSSVWRTKQKQITKHGHYSSFGFIDHLSQKISSFSILLEPEHCRFVFNRKVTAYVRVHVSLYQFVGAGIILGLKLKGGIMLTVCDLNLSLI